MRCSQVYIKIHLFVYNQNVHFCVHSFLQKKVYLPACIQISHFIFLFRVIAIELLTDFKEYSKLEGTHKDHQVQLLSEWWITQPVRWCLEYFLLCDFSENTTWHKLYSLVDFKFETKEDLRIYNKKKKRKYFKRNKNKINLNKYFPNGL